MICAEVSLYPLKTSRGTATINESIASLRQQGVEFTVGSISTHLCGSEEQVWESLREMFSKAQQSGEVSMVMTVTNAAD